jgi:F-type H+-transporting ATPase subunit b
MDLILRQVGELLLGAVPTIVLLLLLYVVYHFLVHRPLERVLEERRAKTVGAIERARADVAAAEAKTAEYENRLREAKLTIFKMQEARRKEAQAARAAAVAEARERAGAQVRQARESIASDIAAAKVSLQAEAERLANEIIRTILQPAESQAPAVGGK